MSRHPELRGERGERGILRVPAVVAILIAGFFGGLLAAPTPTARADLVSITLYGNFATGWGLTPGGETNPGPTITVNEGDVITMRLISEDGTDHGLLIDYNGNGQLDFGLDYSSPTGVDVTFTFTADQSGTFAYYCSIHSAPYSPTSSPMRGTWVTNDVPQATFSSPMAGDSWTGGSAHDVVFDLSSDDALTDLTLWVNYTYNSGANVGTIAGPIAGTANPNVVPWTPTGFTASDVQVVVTAVDTTDTKGVSLSPVFEVDSTAPTIASRSPAPNAVGVSLNSQVRVVWSEPMDAASTASSDAFAVERVTDSTWIAGTIALAPNRTYMTFTPAVPWDPFTGYEVHVNGTALDDSDPGNAFVGDNWMFTTGSAADTLPPIVAGVAGTPDPAEAGGTVNLTASVTDNEGVAGVSAHVVGPSTDVNLTMAPAVGMTWFVERAFVAIGTYDVTVWAEDPSGNVGFGTGTFVVQDTTAPSVANVAASPTTAPPGGFVNLSAEVQDGGVLASVSARVVGPGFDMNLTMAQGAGDTWYVNRTYSALGAYTFTVWALDSEGNVGLGTGSFSIASAPPPPAPTNVAATARADGTILVTWAAVTGDVAGYNVYRATSLAGPFTKLTSAPVPASSPREYVDADVQAGVTYHYVVTAVDADGNESPVSAHASATVPLPPAGPDYLLWIVAGILAAAGLFAVVLVLRRRKKPRA